MGEIDVDHKLREIQREYLEFLDDEEDKGIYHAKVKTMIEDQKIRIVVNVNDLRAKNPTRATELLKNAFEEQIAFQKALYEYVTSVDSNYVSQNDEFFISFEGSFGNKHVTPRTLTSRFLGNMVCLEGIVTKCSMVYPKVVKSVHYCPTTGRTMERRYTDMTSYDPFPSSSVYPVKDDDGNLLETEYGKSVYKDHQTMSVQEMPEKSPAGQLPRSVDIICDNDLVDLCKPGDRLQIIGTYRCLPGKKGGFTSGTFRTILIANHITQLSNRNEGIDMTREDVRNCRKLAKRKDIFELLSKSLAPSIHGHQQIKEAILCMLLGGVEKVLLNGTRLRGDINLLLIGDPSVAKSQLLRYVLHTAPRAIPTTGRGSSGVGLTAAVTTDVESGERRLEAGAMVLADRGIVCIDEFDKMSDIDRTAIHEVMEQGRVSISKAGIHARLNARCSVLAAANPVYGRYDEYRTPMENIGLQDSLLSRFDLLFVMLDVVDKDVDKNISDHVVRMHRYRKPGEQDGEVLSTGAAVDVLSTRNLEELTIEGRTSEIFEKYDPLLHGSMRTRRDKILTIQFTKKYIHFAKKLKPVLSDEAAEMISDEYSKLRSEDQNESDIARTQPITARTLETLIRLSTAHAKARLSRSIEAVDAACAISLIHFAIFQKILEKPKKRKRRSNSVGDGYEDSDQTEDGDTENERDKEDTESRRSQKRNRTGRSVYDFEEDTGLDSQNVDLTVRENSDAQHVEEQMQNVFQLPAPTTILKERLAYFRAKVAKFFSQENSAFLDIEKVIEYVNQSLPAHESPFTGGEVASAIQKMSDENEVMLFDGKLFMV
ncbi:hypothetical protein PGB90_010619 [Kerria lacca]